MFDILYRAGCLIAVILLGMFLRKVGMFRHEDYPILAKIGLNVTLPGMLITSFADFKFDVSLLLLVPVGLLANVLLSVAGYLAAGKEKRQRVFNYINYSGFNIGSFTLPFIQSFLGPTGIVAACMFDTGNAIMCTGMTYSIGAALLPEKGEKQGARTFLKSLLTSVPFMTYVILLAVTLLGIRIPEAVTGFTSIIGAANPFLAMFMLGIVFEFHPSRKNIKLVLKNVGIRCGVCAVLAVLSFFVLPFPLEVRQALVLVLFSPITMNAPVFTDRLHLDTAMAGAINSFCIPVSLILLTVLMACMGL